MMSSRAWSFGYRAWVLKGPRRGQSRHRASTSWSRRCPFPREPPPLQAACGPHRRGDRWYGSGRAFELEPHQEETWKLSTDHQFIEKVRDVGGLYLNPPAKAMVLCLDEKSQIQALTRSAPILPCLPTTPARRTYDYVPARLAVAGCGRFR